MLRLLLSLCILHFGVSSTFRYDNGGGYTSNSDRFGQQHYSANVPKQILRHNYGTPINLYHSENGYVSVRGYYYYDEGRFRYIVGYIADFVRHKPYVIKIEDAERPPASYLPPAGGGGAISPPVPPPGISTDCIKTLTCGG